MFRQFAHLLIVLPALSLAQDNDPSIEQMESALVEFDRLYQQEEFKEALPFVEKAYEIGNDLLPQSDKRLGELSYLYGDTLSRVSGSRGDSRAILSTALEQYESMYGENSVESIPVLVSLGRGHATYDRDTARNYLKKATQLSRSAFGKNSVKYADVSVEAGEIIFWLVGSSEVKAYFDRARKIYLKNVDGNRPKVAQALYLLGRVSARNHRWVSAEKYYVASLEYRDGHAEDEMETFLITHVLLANLYREQGRPEDAVDHDQAFSRFAVLFERASEKQPWALFRSVPNYPTAAYEQGISGRVDFLFTVDEHGFVKNPVVLELEGSEEFIGAAFDATKSWRYIPKVVDGKAIESHGNSTRVTFWTSRTGAYTPRNVQDLGWMETPREFGQPLIEP